MLSSKAEHSVLLSTEQVRSSHLPGGMNHSTPNTQTSQVAVPKQKKPWLWCAVQLCLKPVT